MGPGKADLLRAIDETGSISAAARRMEMSYRRAWLLVDTMNQAFKSPVVVTLTGGKAGGGAAVTEFGKEVLQRYSDMEEKASASVARELRIFYRHDERRLSTAVSGRAPAFPPVSPGAGNRGKCRASILLDVSLYP